MASAVARMGIASDQRLDAIVAAVVISGVIFELVRRKHLMERYALLWLLAGMIVLILGLWKGLLTSISSAVGIKSPPNLLFVVVFAFVLIMLVQFSITVSRLSDQNKQLAQRVALLEHEQQLAALGVPDDVDSAPAGPRAPDST
jgi:hypothetical protein